MNAIHLRPYQKRAISAIREALTCNQKHIVVEIATGCGKGLVLAKTVEMINKENAGNILILADRLEVKAQIKDILFNSYQNSVEVDKYRVAIETEQRILRQQDIKVSEYSFVMMRLYQKEFMKHFFVKRRRLLFLLQPLKRTHTGFLRQRMLYFHTIIRMRSMMATLLRQWTQESWSLLLNHLAGNY